MSAHSPTLSNRVYFFCIADDFAVTDAAGAESKSYTKQRTPQARL